jgi:hypothetical protein
MIVTICKQARNKDNASQFDDGVLFLASVGDLSTYVAHADNTFKIFINHQYMTATTSYKKAVGMAVMMLNEAHEGNQDS